jgi:response regulator RpfG family c-di-GMP phosphodiesterase
MTKSENRSQTGGDIKSNCSYVDDEMSLLDMAQIALKHSGHKIWTAQNLEDARDIIHSNPIEIVLADLTLEEENDGIILLDELIPRAPGNCGCYNDRQPRCPNCNYLPTKWRF